MRRGLIAVAALLASGCETAAVEHAWTPPEPSSTVLTPAWAERAPSARDVMAAYPPDALSRDVEGLARLRCTVTPERKLDCVVDSETPTDFGFGAAGLAVAGIFVVRSGYPAAQPGAVVVVPVRFVVG